MTAKDSKARQLNRISSCIRDQIAVTPLLKYYACKISCNALRKISTSIGNQLQKKDLRWSSRNIGYRAPKSSDKSPRNLRPLTIRTRANNVRSLFLNELCNFPPNLGQRTRGMPTSWGSAQVGLFGLIRQASCSVAVQLLVQLSRTVMRSQFVVLIASLGLGPWPDSSRLRTYSVSTTVSIPTSGRAGSGLDQTFHTTAVDMRACGRRSCHSSIRRRPGRTEHCPITSLDPGWEDTPVRVPANGPAVVVLALMVNLPCAALAQPAVTHQPAEYGVVIE